MEQPALAASQFGAAASDYLTSAAHAQGADLCRLTGMARAAPGLAALDLGCGAGHAAFALAVGGAAVTACDLAPEMLAVVTDEAQRRGLAVRVQQSQAERLPFQDASFDLVVSRFSAHHWADVPAALREVARVLRPGGHLAMIDVVAPEAPLLDTLLQAVEILRDASHVRDYRVSEWEAMLRTAGFEAPAAETWRLPLDFAAWVGRMRTPAARVAMVRDLFTAAPDAARRHFEVRPDGSFTVDVAWMQSRVAALS